MKNVTTSAETRAVFRTPILLLILANLALLGVRLWPWPQVTSLPGGTTTGIDPAVTLVAYIAIAFWISGVRTDSARRAMFSSALIGLVAGLCLIGEVLLSTSPEAAGPNRAQIGLIVAAIALWSIAGARVIRSGETLGAGAVCAAWSAMVSCLMGSAALLAQGYLTAPAADSPDPWKDYQGIAIGSPAMQSLVNSLDMVTAFLVLGPLAACLAATLVGSLVKPAGD